MRTIKHMRLRTDSAHGVEHDQHKAHSHGVNVNHQGNGRTTTTIGDSPHGHSISVFKVMSGGEPPHTHEFNAGGLTVGTSYQGKGDSMKTIIHMRPRTDVGSGPGSRGGKIIGRTKSGKPIYASHNHPTHKEFSSSDHRDAVTANIKRAVNASGKEMTIHLNTAQAHDNDQIRINAGIPKRGDT